MYISTLGEAAVQAARQLVMLQTEEKNSALRLCADHLEAQTEMILEANGTDIMHARANQMKDSLVDRLLLTEERIRSMAEGLREIATLEDPVGQCMSEMTRPNGLHIKQIRVPFGVIGIIYESRPNVTADAFGLCFKTGNAVILRGGKDAIHSNLAITRALRSGLAAAGVSADAIQMVSDTSREVANEMMRCNRYIDVLIPRGGAGLIQTVIENSTVPVIETGTGNCHIYIDASADVNKAVSIIINAKTRGEREREREGERERQNKRGSMQD